MIKFRSFSFYKYANPSIKNGGFYGDSKMEIYNLLPAGLYPRTALIQKNKEINLGTWQGIFLYEHRFGSFERFVDLHFIGD